MSKAEAQINKTAVRQLLKLWESPIRLAQHPLAKRPFIAIQVAQSNLPSTQLTIGLAVKELLNDAIQALRPTTGTPNPQAREWRPFLIVTQRYCLGRLPEWIMVELSISQRTFYRELEVGLSQLVGYLQQHELSTVDNTAVARTVPATLFDTPALPNQPLLGRKSLMTEVKNQLLSGKTRIVALYGLPGVGKSSVVLQLAHKTSIRHRFKDGVIWVGVGPSPDLSALLGGIAQHVGLSKSQIAQANTVDTLVQRIRERIQDQQLLFILDDVWSDDIGQLLLLGGVQSVHLLTMRQPEVALSLAGPWVTAVSALDTASSRKLLQQLLPANNHLEEDVAWLFDWAGGLPLALLVLGRYLNKQAYTGQSIRWQKAMADLQNRRTRLQLKTAHTPLIDIVGLSLDGLEADVFKPLTQLCQLPPQPNSFSLETAVAIAQMTDTMLYSLIDQGLIAVQNDERLSIHQVIHDVILERTSTPLNPTPFIKHFALWCEQNPANFLALDIERLNVEAALAYAFKHKQIEPISQILIVMTRYWIDRGRADFASTQIAQASLLTQELNHPTAEARLAVCHGRLADWQQESEAALKYFQQGWEMAETLKLPQVALTSRVAALQNCLRHGRTQQASSIGQQIADQMAHISDARWQASAYLSLSAETYFRSDYEKSFEYVKKARTLYESVGETAVLASIFQNLGALAVELGRYDVAFTQYEVALEHAHQSGNQAKEAQILNNIGVAALKTGQWRKANEMHQHALRIRRTLHDEDGIAQSLSNLAVMSITMANYAQAEAFLNQTYEIVVAQKQRWRECLCFINWAWLTRLQLKFDASVEVALRAVASARALERQQLIGEGLVQLGRTLLHQKQFSSAQDALQEARLIWQASGQPHLLAETAVYLAQTYLVQQKLAEAQIEIAPAVAYLTQMTYGFEDAGQAMLDCASILTAVGQPKQAELFDHKARIYISQQSYQIESPTIRQIYTAKYG